MSHVDDIALAAARETLGLVRASDLRAAGIAASTIRRRLQRGTWTEPHPGVIDVTGAPCTWARTVRAAIRTDRLIAACTFDPWFSRARGVGRLHRMVGAEAAHAALETDSRLAAVRDDRRDARVAEIGWHVVHLTEEAVLTDRRTAMARIEAALRDAGWRPRPVVS